MNEMIVHRILYETSSRNLLIWFQKKVTPLSLSSLTCGGRGRCSQRRGRGLRNKSWGRYHEPSQHLGPGQPERGLSFSSYLSYCLTKCFPTVPTYKRLGLKTYNLCQNRRILQDFCSHLLLFLGSGGSDTDHPDQQHQQDEEDDGSGDAWNVII